MLITSIFRVMMLSVWGGGRNWVGWPSVSEPDVTFSSRGSISTSIYIETQHLGKASSYWKDHPFHTWFINLWIIFVDIVKCPHLTSLNVCCFVNVSISKLQSTTVQTSYQGFESFSHPYWAEISGGIQCMHSTATLNWFINSEKNLVQQSGAPNIKTIVQNKCKIKHIHNPHDLSV